MLSRLKSWLGRRALADARRIRAEAREALEQAESRGDTRTIGLSRMILARATDDVLRLELGRP